MLLNALPPGESRPAVGIVAHTRKPRADERASGRALLNVLSGSFLLTAAARAVFVLQHASDEVEETRVVMTCAKNNDGQPGPRSAWERRNGLFTPVPDFDWEAFEQRGEKSGRSLVTVEHLEKIFANGPLQKSEAVASLMKLAGISKTTAYRVLESGGEFGTSLVFNEGQLSYLGSTS